jgi:hypothetical protein
MRLWQASKADAQHLRRVLDRIGHRFGTRVEIGSDDMLHLKRNSSTG